MTKDYVGDLPVRPHAVNCMKCSNKNDNPDGDYCYRCLLERVANDMWVGNVRETKPRTRKHHP